MGQVYVQATLTIKPFLASFNGHIKTPYQLNYSQSFETWQNMK